ncbi:hypothetical protein RVR_P1129 (plasmid) [Actinacidiphila reveromycinica]|uniref:Uncharacterized protein n=1 Tax=Actinacidiphila reveromycinica TaxID=659352 RepID=A0A7U3QW48_9ACTN|nr:hypothetical protein [Streptomyces sp. SN-593]BBG20743.1 hypothetical protein RVR_P1129 [Streptomyces sp. SN-593]
MSSDPHTSEDEPRVTVAVQLDVTETVSYGFRAEVTIPASVAADPAELHDHMAQDEELWLDSLDPTGAMGGSIDVLERAIDSVTLCAAGDGPASEVPRGAIRDGGPLAPGCSPKGSRERET